MIALYDRSTNQKIAYLDDIIIADTVEITRRINGEFHLSFAVLEDNLKSLYLETETYVVLGKDYFDIAYVEMNHAGAITYRIEGEHVTYRLLAAEKEFYTFDGTPAQILSDLLAGTEFMVGTVEAAGITTFAVHEETNKLALLQLLANHTGMELDFEGFYVDLKNTLGEDRGFQARLGKNLRGTKKIIDRRQGLTCYALDLLELKSLPAYGGFEDLERVKEGDTIRIIDEAMGLDVKSKVIKRRYNPLRQLNTHLEIANTIELLTDSITRIRRDTVAKNKLYHGIRISPDTGFESIRSDKKARGVFNSEILALQTGDGSGMNWTNKLYFDPAQGRYIFDGLLSATMIEALRAEFDVTISNVTITNILAAETGYIAKLTVDSLESSRKVQNYLARDTSDVNYIKIYKQYLQFITASTDGQQIEQAKDRDGKLLYWLDDAYEGITLTDTGHPVFIYHYLEQVKMELTFAGGMSNEPVITMGVGDGTGGYNAKAVIRKGVTGLELNYYKSNTGALRRLSLGDEGIIQSGSDGPLGLRNIAVGPAAPLNPQNNDLWIDTLGGGI